MPDKDKYIQRVKSHHEATTGIKLADADALCIFENLITLVSAVYKPISKEFFQDLKCHLCEEKIDINEFTDELSQKEFIISGLCRICQDKTFQNEENN